MAAAASAIATRRIANSFGRPDPLQTPHPIFQTMATNAVDRHYAYRTLLRESISDDELQGIRDYVQQ